MEEYRYRYEMHVHDNWCSACATKSPMEMAEAYWKAGYTGMVFTNHFLLGNTAVDRTLPWEDKARAYWDAHLAAREWAEKNTGGRFHVLFGLEHAYGHGKEVLTYGIDLSFLLAHPNLHLYSLDDYAAAVHEAGGFLSQAHPFRRRDYIDPGVLPRPELLDGAEVFNFFNKEDENREAAAFAEKYGLLPTSGADAHGTDPAYVGKAGVALRAPVDSPAELAAVLRAGKYRLIINGEIVDGYGID